MPTWCLRRRRRGKPSGPSRPYQLLLLSARSANALENATTNLANHLKAHPELNLADVSYTLAGRRAFAHRRVLVAPATDTLGAAAALESADPQRVHHQNLGIKGPERCLFMFSGQGSQYVDMGRELYDVEPAFRSALDNCCDALRGNLGFDLRDVLYPPPEQREQAAARLQRTAVTQPALFAVEYALAKLWMEFGIEPKGMIGHSIGEYVAACLAGVFSLEDALDLVAARGRLMDEMPAGSMLAAPLSESRRSRSSTRRLPWRRSTPRGSACSRDPPRRSTDWVRICPRGVCRRAGCIRRTRFTRA